MCQWKEIAAPPELRRAVVHVWKTWLTEDTADLAPCCVPREERSRLQRAVQQAVRRRRLAARTALRCILGVYLGKPARDVALTEAVRGKPELAAPDARTGLSFSLAHSEDLALCAVTLHDDVGADVEYVRPRNSISKLVDRFFTPEEARTFAALPENRRANAFYRAWTVKESVLKAEGLGLHGHLGQVAATMDQETPPQLLDAPGGATAWTIKTFQPESGYTAACAVRGAANAFAFYRWG